MEEVAARILQTRNFGFWNFGFLWSWIRKLDFKARRRHHDWLREENLTLKSFISMENTPFVEDYDAKRS